MLMHVNIKTQRVQGSVWGPPALIVIPSSRIHAAATCLGFMILLYSCSAPHMILKLALPCPLNSEHLIKAAEAVASKRSSTLLRIPPEPPLFST